MSDGTKLGEMDPAEVEGHRAVLEGQAEQIQKQLDRGVTRAEFKQLYTLQSAVKRAAGVLADIRAAMGRR